MIIISFRIERINRKKLFNFLFIYFIWNKQKYNFKILRTCSDWSEWFLRRPPIGRIFLVIQNSSKWTDPNFWVLIWLMDINCNVLSKLFANFFNLSLPSLGVESLKPCCCCSMKSFLLVLPSDGEIYTENKDYLYEYF